MIVEKPLALTLDDGKAIAAAAAAAGRHAMVSQNYRFRRQSRALRDLVQLPRARLSPRDPHLVPARPARRLDLAARLAGPDAAPVSARHGDPPRRHAPHDHGRRGRGGRCAQLGRSRRAVQARPHGGGAAHARRRHARLLRGNVGGAPRADLVERRLGAARRPGACDVVGGRRRRAARNGAVRAARRACPARAAAVAAGARPARGARGAAAGARGRRRAGVLRRRQPAQPLRDPGARPLDGGAPAGPPRGDPRSDEDRSLPGAVRRPHARGGARRRCRGRLRDRRDHVGSLELPLPARRAPRRRDGARPLPLARDRPRARDLGALVPRKPAASRRRDRGDRRSCLPGDGAARGRARGAPR